MKKDPIIFIEHILDSLNKIEKFLGNLTKEEFKRNEIVQDAILRRIEIIGEAVKNIPLSFRNKYKNISWSDIAATRNKIIHHYFGININIIWDIIKDDIPILKKNIINILEKETVSWH